MQAYIHLRKSANLLITLFTMMLSTGIPELGAREDLEYLRKTLRLDSGEKDALSYFSERFAEAHSGGKLTKMDWVFHWIRR